MYIMHMYNHLYILPTGLPCTPCLHSGPVAHENNCGWLLDSHSWEEGADCPPPLSAGGGLSGQQCSHHTIACVDSGACLCVCACVRACVFVCCAVLCCAVLCCVSCAHTPTCVCCLYVSLQCVLWASDLHSQETCHMFWPPVEGGTLEVGSMKITMVKSTATNDIDTYQLTVEKPRSVSADTQLALYTTNGQYQLRFCNSSSGLTTTFKLWSSCTCMKGGNRPVQPDYCLSKAKIAVTQFSKYQSC